MLSSRPSTRPPGRRLALGLFLTLSATLGPGLSFGQSRAPNYGDLSLEELMEEIVTSVSKREQKRSDAPAAISVLSNEDLRRSGATNVADALRLVPGMSVSSVNASQWAVSARGFNGLYANKLLVLVDGRAVYSPLFAGVYWDLQQTMMEDVDRIEVIRGPGATVWGANAVNGVVNVVTRGAKDTQGGVVYGSLGDVRETHGGVRYGGQLDEKTYYRVYAGAQSTDDYRLPGGGDASDGWRGRTAGLRLDHHPSDATQLTWQAEGTDSNTDDDLTQAYNLNTLGRLTRRWSDRSNLEVQAYYDRTARDESSLLYVSSDTFDLTAQHTLALGERQEIVWGVGYRFISNELKETTPLVQVRNGRLETNLFSAFIQDEFKLVPDKLLLTAGVKIEHNDYTGLELQPGARGVFKPTATQTFWAALSRAVRTPAGVESEDLLSAVSGPPFSGPGGGLYLPRVIGDTRLSSETLWAHELGYRFEPNKRFSLDLALFYNVYDDVIAISEPSSFIPGAPVGTVEIPFANALHGKTGGGEVSVTFAPSDTWRLTASYALLLTNIEGPAASSPDEMGEGSPRNQVVLRSSHDFTRRLRFDAQLRYADLIRSAPAYVTADLRLAYQLNDRLEASIVGQNLLEDQHLEQGFAFGAAISEVPRGFYGKLVWHF